MSWGGYIPGHILREIIEREELRMFSEAKPGLVEKVEKILDEDLYAYEGFSCSCCGSSYTIEDKDVAARRIVELFESVLKPDVPQ